MLIQSVVIFELLDIPVFDILHKHYASFSSQSNANYSWENFSLHCFTPSASHAEKLLLKILNT